VAWVLDVLGDEGYIRGYKQKLVPMAIPIEIKPAYYEGPNLLFPRN